MPRDFKSRPIVNGSSVALATDTGGVVGTYSFAPTDAIERHVVTDANVHSTSKIIGTIRRPTTEEVDDYGWFYKERIVSIQEGSFVLQTTLQAIDELSDGEFSSLKSKAATAVLSHLGTLDSPGSYSNISTGPSNAATAIPINYSGIIDSVSVYLTGENVSDSLLTASFYTDVSGSPGTEFSRPSIPNNVPLNILDTRDILVDFYMSPIILPGACWLVLKRQGPMNVSGSSTFHAIVGGTPNTKNYNLATQTWSGPTSDIAYTLNRSYGLETLNYDYIVI